MRSAIPQPQKGIPRLASELSAQTCAGVYSFGFNGKENDNEVYGSAGTFQDYGMRSYDCRVARFFRVDPISAQFPWYTPYQFAGNKPIAAVDQDGLEEFVVIRWYSSDGIWNGCTVFKITDARDRYFGAEGILYLNLNRALNTTPDPTYVKQMFGASSSRPDSESRPFTDVVSNPANGIVDGNGKLIVGVGFMREYPAVNETERRTMDNVEKTIRKYIIQGISKVEAKRVYRPPAFINFNHDDATLAPGLDIDKNNESTGQEIDKMVLWLNENPEYHVALTGNASTEGDTQHNKDLAARRVTAVKSYLIAAGVAADRIVTTASGESAPISTDASQNDASKPSINRNVQVTFMHTRQNQ